MSDQLNVFFSQLWRDEGYYCISYGEINPTNLKWFTNIEEAINFSKETDKLNKFNIWHGCAVYQSDKDRKSANARTFNALWVDIDSKINSWADIKKYLISIFECLKQSPFGDDCWIINSGHGIHLYWMLDRSIERQEWLSISKELKNLIYPIYKEDLTRVCDAASLMRFPNSTNFKQGKEPVKSKILREQKSLSSASFLLEQFNSKEEIEEVIEKVKQESVSDAEVVANKCRFIEEFSKTGFHENEPAWYAALGAVKFCIDGKDWCHAWSSKDIDYKKRETDKKLKQLDEKVNAPTTCQKIKEFGFCNGCQHENKITTPIQLGFFSTAIEQQSVLEASDKVKETRADECLKLVPTKHWSIVKEGIYFISQDMPILMSKIPFYVIDLVMESHSDESIQSAVILIYKEKKSIIFTLPLRLLAETKKLMAEFNCRKVFPTKPSLVVYYISEYVQNLDMHGINPQRIAVSLGWQPDGSFMYKEDGSTVSPKGEDIKLIPDRRTVTGYARGFSSKGKIEEWAKILNIFKSHESFNSHLFGVFCSIATPLLPWTAATGIALSFEGETGGGKTVAHMAAMSVWGDSEFAGVLSTKDTVNSVLGRLAAMRHLPLRLDEATNFTEKQLSGLVFELVNGRGRSRSAADGSLATTAVTWNTLTLITTNKPLLDMDLKTITEAERVRILELPIDKKQHLAKMFSEIAEIIKANYGLVGIEFIRWFVKNKDSILNKLKDEQNRLYETIDSSKRFWVACLSISSIAIQFTKEFFGFDFYYINDWVFKILLDIDRKNTEIIEETRGFSTLEEFTAALLDSLNGFIEYRSGNSGRTLTDEAKLEVKAMLIQDDGGKKYLYVRPPVLKSFVAFNYIQGFQRVKEKLGIEKAITRHLGGKKICCYKFFVGENNDQDDNSKG